MRSSIVKKRWHATTLSPSDIRAIEQHSQQLLDDAMPELLDDFADSLPDLLKDDDSDDAQCRQAESSATAVDGKVYIEKYVSKSQPFIFCTMTMAD